MTTDYTDEKPRGLQIDWIARKLGIEPSKLQEAILQRKQLADLAHQSF